MRSVSRRALLRGGALGVAAVTVTACATRRPERLAAEPPDPETVLIKQLIAAKERTVALYSSAASVKLAPFRERHEAHLAELRRRLPPDATPAERSSPSRFSPSQSSPPPAPDAQDPDRKVSLRTLRELERRAAALRARQLDGISPSLTQLIASIGACEAAHALALSRPL